MAGFRQEDVELYYEMGEELGRYELCFFFPSPNENKLPSNTREGGKGKRIQCSDKKKPKTCSALYCKSMCFQTD